MRLFGFLTLLVLCSSGLQCCSVNAVQERHENNKVDTELELGIDQIGEWSTKLKDKSVGVVSNQTSLLNSVHLVDTLVYIERIYM